VEAHAFGKKGQRLSEPPRFVTAGNHVHAAAIFQQEERQSHTRQSLARLQEAHQGISLDVHPPEWHSIALQKVPVFLDTRRRSPAHDVDLVLFSLHHWHVSFHANTYWGLDARNLTGARTSRFTGSGDFVGRDQNGRDGPSAASESSAPPGDLRRRGCGQIAR
jgi:hypothetical protein